MNPNISLNQKMRLIGLRIGFDEKVAPRNKLNALDYDLEETLIESIYEAQNDLRILRILVSWIKIHGGYVIVEKLFKRLKAWESIRGVNPIFELLIGIAVTSGHLKWGKYGKATPKKPIYPGNETLLKSSISVKGEDENLSKLGIKVPRGYLNPRDSDVFTPNELLSVNHQYRNRYLFGPNWRADIITAIECGFENPSQISKKIGCSYEPAYRTYHEYQAWKSSS